MIGLKTSAVIDIIDVFKPLVGDAGERKHHCLNAGFVNWIFYPSVFPVLESFTVLSLPHSDPFKFMYNGSMPLNILLFKSYTFFDT